VKNSGIWQWAVMGLSALSLLLVVVNGALVIRNQSAQLQVNQRQQAINQGQQYARIRQIIAQVVAGIAVQKSDPDLTTLLARHGITINSQAAPSAATGTSPAPATATAPAPLRH
jgi:uncharacterized protein YpmS